jgi:hypothetical protein
MEGIEEEHGDVGPHLADQVRHDDALGLKARRDAGDLGVNERAFDRVSRL